MPEPLRIFLADDEQPARNRLRDLLADCNDSLPLKIVGEAGNGKAVLEALSQTDADVLLLDIHMPGADGLDVAQALTQRAHAPAIIFVTAFDSHAIAAFELDARDYLLKPVRAERLLAALRKVSAAAPAIPAPNLRATARGQTLLIPLNDVLWLRAEQKYVTAFTRQGSYLLEDSLAGLEQSYPNHWLRIHRHSLVARHAVIGLRSQHEGELTGLSILLRGWDQALPVSRRQHGSVKQAVKSL